MTIRVACVCVALVVLLLFPVMGQETAMPAAPATGAPDAAEAVRKVAEGEVDPIDFLRQMGAKEEDILRLQFMAQVTGADMGELMLLMMLAKQGESLFIHDPGQEQEMGKCPCRPRREDHYLSRPATFPSGTTSTCPSTNATARWPSCRGSLSISSTVRAGSAISPSFFPHSSFGYTYPLPSPSPISGHRSSSLSRTYG